MYGTFQCTVYIEEVFYIEEIWTFPSCVLPTYFVAEIAKRSLEYVRTIVNKARKVFGTSLQEATETAGNIESHDLLTWLAPFITTRKTKSDVSVKVEQS